MEKNKGERWMNRVQAKRKQVNEEMVQKKLE
jgi:hypothetical protein